jgi:HK97 family phage portal protein
VNPIRAVASWFNGFFDKRLWSVGGGRTTTAKENVSEDSALNYSAVWCATRLLCGTGASLPFPVYTGYGTDERSKARSHPLFRILNGRPNPEQTAYSFRSVMWQWQVNWGNAYAEITREGGSPDAPLDSLWPIHPSRVQVCRDENESLYYKVSNEFGGGHVELDPWQMLHIPSIITHDGITGHGVIEHARETIGAGIAQEKFGAHTFVSGVPRAVVEMQAKWDEPTRKAFRSEWEEIYGGADKSRIALLQGGAKLVPFNFNAEDSQFLETRQFSVEEIARWYGIPPHLLQHLLRATFNNIEELGINFVQYSLIPWLRVWEQCCSQKLLTEQEQENYFAEHNVDALMRGNAASRSSFYQTMTSSALMTRNECRRLENLDPVEGGDTFLVQGAMVPLDEEGRPDSEFVKGKEPAVQPALPVGDEEDEGTEDEPVEDVSVKIAGRVKRILAHDLARILTKESKAVLNHAKHPAKFIGKVDAFYSEHHALVVDAVSESLGALTACGISVDAEVFVATWISEGKSAILEAAGTTVAISLASAIESVIESKTWSERPVRAIERVEHAPS